MYSVVLLPLPRQVSGLRRGLWSLSEVFIGVKMCEVLDWSTFCVKRVVYNMFFLWFCLQNLWGKGHMHGLLLKRIFSQYLIIEVPALFDCYRALPDMRKLNILCHMQWRPLLRQQQRNLCGVQHLDLSLGLRNLLRRPYLPHLPGGRLFSQRQQMSKMLAIHPALCKLHIRRFLRGLLGWLFPNREQMCGMWVDNTRVQAMQGQGCLQQMCGWVCSQWAAEVFAVFDFDIVLPEVHGKGQLHAMFGRILRQKWQEKLFEM